jgi:hypothetical protein
MLRRIVRNLGGGIASSFSGAVLSACAVLAVPFLALTALELPAAAIDRIAAPLSGYLEPVGTASPRSAAVGKPAQDGWQARLTRLVRPVVRTHSATPSLTSTRVAGASGGSERNVPDQSTADGGATWITDWSDGPVDTPASDAPTSGGSAGDGGHEGNDGTGPSEQSAPPGADGGDEQGASGGSGGGDGGTEAPEGDAGASLPSGGHGSDGDTSGDEDAGVAAGGAGGDSSSGDTGRSSDSQSPESQAGPASETGTAASSPDGGDAPAGQDESSVPGDGHGNEDAPGNSGNALGHNKDDKEKKEKQDKNEDAPGNSGNAPGHNKDDEDADPDESPGNSANAPGHNKLHTSS